MDKKQVVMDDLSWITDTVLDPCDDTRVEVWSQQACVAIEEAGSVDQLRQLKSLLLGEKSALTLANRAIKDLPGQDKAVAGKNLGAARKQINTVLAHRQTHLEESELAAALANESVDVTAPTSRFPVGSRHPLSLLIEEVSQFFVSMGWQIADGPEIEHEWYNFDSLNFDPDHPARQMQDTFYVATDTEEGGASSSNMVMRTHTSPVQSRMLLENGVPLYVACPGKVFRSDALDATHTPVFHQIEGLAVDRDITMAHLKGVLDQFAKALFGPEAKTRLRPSYFPFTEPSAEMDFWFPQKKGGPGWIEWGGCGMVNPNVLRANGIDPEQYSGLAFGMGLERTLMLKHGISDMRDIVEGDQRFSQQFGLFGKGL